MKSYAALLKLQLLLRYGWLRPSRLRDLLSENKGRKATLLVAWIILGASLGFTLVSVSNLLLDGLVALQMPDMLLTMASMMAMLSTLVIGFFFIISSLFLSRDSVYLAALPFSPRTLLAARLTGVWMSETVISALFFLPACILYGIRLNVGPAFYITMALVLPLCPVLPLMIVTLLSALLIRVSALWKNRERMVTIGSFVFIILIVFLQMSLTRMIPDDATGEMMAQLIQNNMNMMTQLTRAFIPAEWAGRALMGDVGAFMLLLATCVAALALVIWGLGKVYQPLSLLQSEAAVSTRRVKMNRAAFTGGTPLKALCRAEWRELMRSPVYVINSMASVLMPVIMSVMVLMGMSSSGNMDLSAIVQTVSPELLALILSGLFCFCAGVNPAISTAVSRDAHRMGLLRALPVEPATRMRAKLRIGFTLSAVSPLPIALLLLILMPQNAVAILLSVLVTEMYSLLVCTLSLYLDMVHPRMNWTTENEAIKQNTNAVMSMLIGWVVVGVGALLVYLMMNAGLNAYVALSMVALLFAAAGYGALRMLYSHADRAITKLEA